MNNKTITYFVSMIQNARGLSVKEKNILIKRIQHKNLFAIGKKLKVSGERVRQIEKKALEKIAKKLDQLSLFD